MKYRIFIWKRILEDIFIFPFILYGRYLSRKTPLKDEYEIFFFFPFYHTGGAEKVHQSIANALSKRKAIIIFTRKSHNDQFLQSFLESGHYIIDISAYTDNKFKYWNNLIFRGLVSGHINHQKKKPVVFNGQSNFGYKLSRWISKEISQIELIHSFSSFSYIRVPFIGFYSRTIMISKRRIKDHLNMYQHWGMPESFSSKIEYILNGIPLPPNKPEPKINLSTPLKILYVGRGTREKRIPLLAEIVHHLINKGISMEASFVGDVENAITVNSRSHIHLPGTINDPTVLDQYYRKSDIFLMVSNSEGFPLSIMEAMARGCIIISTDVGDIYLHVKQNENGFLFSDLKNEKLILQEAEQYIQKLISNPELCRQISYNNIEYAYKHFGMNIFADKYQQIIESYLG